MPPLAVLYVFYISNYNDDLMLIHIMIIKRKLSTEQNGNVTPNLSYPRVGPGKVSKWVNMCVCVSWLDVVGGD